MPRSWCLGTARFRYQVVSVLLVNPMTSGTKPFTHWQRVSYGYRLDGLQIQLWEETWMNWKWAFMAAPAPSTLTCANYVYICIFLSFKARKSGFLHIFTGIFETQWNSHSFEVEMKLSKARCPIETSLRADAWAVEVLSGECLIGIRFWWL